ncbi:aminotransferase-like domain-containing protein [Fusibacter ferrireducens]|uniref:PLP-dependent aminotransferase family protein n=1 Tax=Fusibacter ferrireducens TaxID=2785058 RepID=A0ABR9ZN74_9FIRM|nr:PLP-dependent aminotransferase family protein [Fusibacter ferrireducens]MBF4691918.1 PLP-dependent aminotransferase family protein [Fusibacter ferrireducens]
MKIFLDRHSKTSLRQQLYDEFENRIVSGILTANTALPSIRTVSKMAEVSAMTVVKVYEQLEMNNLIYKIQGKGSFVANNLFANNLFASNNESVESHDQWQDKIQDYVVRAGFTQRTLRYKNMTSYNLGIASLHERFLPTAFIMENFLTQYDIKMLLKHPPVEGDPVMIEKVCQHVIDKGIESNPENVIITSGSQAGINLVAQTFVAHGDVVVIESPSFPGAIDVFKSRGAKIIEVPMTSKGLDVNALLEVCEKNPVKLLYTMPNFHNPTGYSARLDVLQEVIMLSKEHNFLVLEDDSWSDLYYDRMERPLKSIDDEGRVLYLIGLSKTLGPSLKLSAIITDPVLRQKLINAKSSIDSSAPLLNQVIVSSYLGSVAHKQHLIWVRHELKMLMKRVKAHMDAIAPPYLKVSYPNGGLVLWITLPSSFDCKLLYYKLMTDASITVLLGEHCYSSINGNNQFRICFSYEEEAHIMESLTRIIHMIEDLKPLMHQCSQSPNT